MKFYSPLRYPGGKAFLSKELERILSKIRLDRPTYVEPYAGGAGAALTLLFAEKVKNIIINDRDFAIFAFWKSVTEHSSKFAEKIIKTRVTVSEWKRQKEVYLNPRSNLFDLGFATFFLNRTNKSGIMNASPIGGMKQDGNYKITARYNKKELAARVLKIGEYKSRIEVQNEDGIELTQQYIHQPNTFIYLDPPYFKQGAMLYMSHYKEEDHVQLADLLNSNVNAAWVLTYDERAKIRNSLYPKRRRNRLSLLYRVRGARKARELMIFSKKTEIAAR